jgi:apurinic endonuclease APN1
MQQLRVRELLKAMDGESQKNLKKLLPKGLKTPELPPGRYPAALLSIFPKDESYSLLGCVAEELLRLKPINLETLFVATKVWFPALTKEHEAKLTKSSTTEPFLDSVRKTQALVDAVTKGKMSYDTVVSYKQVQGHPDAQTPTQIFEVKLTGQFEKNWLDFLFQVYAYAALEPTATDVYLVLPLQETVWHADVTKWTDRVAYRDFLQTLSVKLQDPKDAKSPIPGLMLKATYNIGQHIEKGKLSATLSLLKGSLAPVQLFLGSTLSSKLVIKEEDIALCAAATSKLTNHVYVHSPYIINLSMEPGSMDDYGATLLIKNLDYARRIGLKGVVVHVGKAVKRPEAEALDNMRANLIKCMESATAACPILLETPAGQGTELLTDYDEFLDFVESFKDERLRVCIDTCHVYATGYCPYEYIKGCLEDHRPLLKLVHFNDSHGLCSSCIDRHAFIGTGHIGLDIMTKIAVMCAEKKVDMVVE